MSGTVRVAFDATSLLGAKTGVGYFTEALFGHLARLDDVEVTAFPISIRGRSRLRDVVPPGVEIVTPALPARAIQRWWLRSDVPRIDALIGRPDVVHGPNFVVPPVRAPRVVSVHDLTMVRFPELSNPYTRVFPRLIHRAVRSGAVVHTDTDAVREEVIDRLGVPEEQVVTVHLGYRAMGGGDADRGRRLAGRDDFVLAVGTIEPRKDLPALLRAVDRLDRGGVRRPVVHVGPDGWGVDAFDSALAAMAHPELVTRLGHRSDDDLRDLYAAARLVVYPSIYEGFGFPVLEAMSAGVPVVATSDPAVAEVAGDGALLVGVGDDGALAEAIVAVWSEDTVRSELAEAAHANLERFSWDRCALAMLELYRRIIAED